MEISRNSLPNKLLKVSAILIAGFLFVSPIIASAQSTKDVTAQINKILADIELLKARLAGIDKAKSDDVSCKLERSLGLGSRGEDVRCLQRALNEQHFVVAKTGAGSLRQETDYYGPLTMDAVKRYQEEFEIFNSGFFGPITRSHLISTQASLTAASSNEQKLTVRALEAAGQPVAVAGSAQNPVGRFLLAAPESAHVTISGLTFTKRGELPDNQIRGLYVADATTGAVIAKFQSLASGVARFSDLNISLPAGTTRTLELRLDLSGAATVGSIMRWQLNSINSSVPANGLPAQGPSVAVASALEWALPSLQLLANQMGESLEAGTNNALVGQWTATVIGDEVVLRSLTTGLLGTANPADIRNIKLVIAGVEVAAASQAADEVVFSVPEGVVLPVGNTTLQVLADIVGSPNKTVQLEVLQPYHVYILDASRKAVVVATLVGDSSLFRIESGHTKIQLASDQPTQAIPAGALAATIAKYSVYAAGEPMRIKHLQVSLTATSDDLANIRIVDDAGAQISASQCLPTGQAGLPAVDTGILTCSFGSAEAPLEYIVPANTTRVLSLQADISSQTVLTSIQANLESGKGNLEGQSSFQIINSALAEGPIRSISKAEE